MVDFDSKNSTSILRLRLTIRGAVQGVGFRPFIYRLACEHHLNGWVKNSNEGVIIEVEGKKNTLEDFLLSIEPQKPVHASIQSLEYSYLDPVGHEKFEVKASLSTGKKSAIILPDIATCSDCLEEVFNLADRRFGYPFTNCTNCGPRFSIITALPYDRPYTTMRSFVMCPECQREYDDPNDRRFHAQPNACPKCGPHLELWDSNGSILATHQNALTQCCEAIRQGKVLAVKGIGGFHLMVDAHNQDAVMRLRERKGREEKPFALMYPDLQAVEKDAVVTQIERRSLLSPEAPIVLLQRHASSQGIAPAIAPNNPYLGIVLPFTPLHHLLMKQLGFPIVATSGNLSNDPLCTQENQALERLGEIADQFLVHNRPIHRHVDDSIVRIIQNREMVFRRARGYAPLPLEFSKTLGDLLAVGGHLKNTFAFSNGKQIFVSQHHGDLETKDSIENFTQSIEAINTLYETTPKKIGCDLHPDYYSTQFAKRHKVPVVSVQHHYAHILSCMAENSLEAPVLGVAWDGTGYGTDNTVWGGEFLHISSNNFRRVAHLMPFRLPGGERAVKEPRRTALGLLFELCGPDAINMNTLKPIATFSTEERSVLQTMLQKGLNSPMTSSMGRLFDGVASLLGIRQIMSFEGQAAMELEFAIEGAITEDYYPSTLRDEADKTVIDWTPLLKALLSDQDGGVPRAKIAAKFHNSLAHMIAAIAEKVQEPKVALSGGCFQNKYLLEKTISVLTQKGFRPYWHQRVPTNDGGISLGQIIAVHRSEELGEE